MRRTPRSRASVNEQAARRGPIVFLTVPFRAQSENLNNLREALEPGQILVDCTVPTAAAVGRQGHPLARRLAGLGRPAGAGDGARRGDVVAALHTVSAPSLGDPDAELDEDVLICGDRKADKARVARLIELIPGLRAVNAGALEMARIVEQLTPLLISINVRYKAHAGIRITGLAATSDHWVGASSVRVALLAGGTGGAKLAAGMQDLVGADLAVIANTADDTRIHGLHVSPDPDLITYWLAGEIDEERGWGIRDDTFTVHERLERLGAPGWFQLSDRDLATCLYRTHFIAEGGTLTAAQGQIARALGVTAAVLPMCEEPVETRVLTPGGWRGLQEFLIVDGSEPDDRGRRGRRASTRRSPRPRSSTHSRAAEAIVLGPSNPVISIGPILAVPGCGRRSPPRARRSSR